MLHLISFLLPAFQKADVSISHLMFANDMIVFSKATHYVAGDLKPQVWLSIGQKVPYFFSNCMDEDQVAITFILSILEAYLPIRYLGVPLSSKRLTFSVAFLLWIRFNNASLVGNPNAYLMQGELS